VAGRSSTDAACGALEPESAFVVQLRSDAGMRRRLSGRVEHVMSGRSEQFASLAGLLAFMRTHANLASAPTAPGRTRTRRK